MTNYLEEALKLYKETADRFPNDVFARNGLATTLRDMGRLEEAIAVHHETIQMFPMDLVARHGYAETLKAMGRFEEALVTQQATMEMFPNDAVGHISLADTLARIGKIEESIIRYRQAIDKYPDNPVARNGLAEILRFAASKMKTDDDSESQDHGDVKFKYQVALSFAGEDRLIARKLARVLSEQGISVFYDEYEKANLWGKDLYQHLAQVYSRNAQYCVVIISKHYARKLWTKHELKQAQERAFRENREYILPLRLDDTDIPGITETTAYINLQKVSVESVARSIIEKLGSNID